MNIMFIINIKLILGVYNNVYLLVNFHNNKLIIIILHKIIIVIINQIWNINNVKVTGIIIPIGENQSKCLNILILVKRKGINKIK